MKVAASLGEGEDEEAMKEEEEVGCHGYTRKPGCHGYTSMSGCHGYTRMPGCHGYNHLHVILNLSFCYFCEVCGYMFFGDIVLLFFFIK